MCQICLDWEKEKLTAKEAMRNIGEMIHSSKGKEESKHLLDLADKILSKEVPMNEADPGMDETWEKEHREK